MGPTNNIGYLLQHVAFILARQSDQVLQEQLGVGFSQFKILMILSWSADVQQKQIASQLGQTEASISRQIRLLEDRGLLSVHVRPENRRQHVVRLSTKGERLTEKAWEILNNYHAPAFENIGAKQQQQLLNSLNTLHKLTCHEQHLL